MTPQLPFSEGLLVWTEEGLQLQLLHFGWSRAGAIHAVYSVRSRGPYPTTGSVGSSTASTSVGVILIPFPKVVCS